MLHGKVGVDTMATLIVGKGASPQMGQKQVTNYVYVPSGDEIQTIDNVYTETEIPSGRLEMYVPDMHSFNAVFHTPCWYNDKEQRGEIPLLQFYQAQKGYTHYGSYETIDHR